MLTSKDTPQKNQLSVGGSFKKTSFAQMKKLGMSGGLACHKLISLLLEDETSVPLKAVKLTFTPELGPFSNRASIVLDMTDASTTM